MRAQSGIACHATGSKEVDGTHLLINVMLLERLRRSQYDLPVRLEVKDATLTVTIGARAPLLAVAIGARPLKHKAPASAGSIGEFSADFGIKRC